MKNLAIILTFTFTLFSQNQAFAQTQTFVTSVSKSVLGGYGRSCASHRETELVNLEGQLQAKAQARCIRAKRISAFRYLSKCADETASVFSPDNFRIYKVEAEFVCPKN